MLICFMPFVLFNSIFFFVCLTYYFFLWNQLSNKVKNLDVLSEDQKIEDIGCCIRDYTSVNTCTECIFWLLLEQKKERDLKILNSKVKNANLDCLRRVTLPRVTISKFKFSRAN